MLALEHRQLTPDPENVRRRITGIASLADSINEYGLMQNLVVRPSPHKGQYYIVAGERRWHAIALLIEQGRWPREEAIPALCVDSDGVWENLVENHQRSDVPPWEVGNRFIELLDAGRTQTEIAGRLRMATGRVSRLVAIAKGLAPETINYLQKQPTRWTLADLYRIAGMRLPAKHTSIEEPEPDVEAQLKYAKSLLGEKKGRNVRKARPAGNKQREAVWRRFKKLRDEYAPKTGQERRIIAAVVAYLTGKSRTLKLDQEL